LEKKSGGDLSEKISVKDPIYDKISSIKNLTTGLQLANITTNLARDILQIDTKSLVNSMSIMKQEHIQGTRDAFFGRDGIFKQFL
jgi:hypothetical protein